MDIVAGFLATIVSLFSASAPYLLFGFLLAGFIKVLVPEELVGKHLGANRFRSVGLAALVGIPLPLCSCSVLPTAASLRKSGASKGATTAFLISTPETGLDSIGVTWALLDPFMTVIRPLGALLTALLTGTLVNLLVRAGWDKDGGSVDAEEAECDTHDHAQLPPVARGRAGATIRQGTAFAFGPLLDDLSTWLFIGFLMSGVFALAIPDGFFEQSFPNGWPAFLLMLVIGIPTYVCAAGATPLAAVLIAKGLDPGAALVLLLAGPATNLTTLGVITKLLGKRIAAIYLLGVSLCALLIGAFASGLYINLHGIDLRAIAAATMRSPISPIEAVASLPLLVLLIQSARRVGLAGKSAALIRRLCTPLGFDPTGRSGQAGAVVLISLLYFSTAITVVGPGESAFIVRFGRVVRAIDRPGPVLHLPTPVDHVTRVQREVVRGVDSGFERKPFDAPPGRLDISTRNSLTEELQDEAEVMTGDESILTVSYSVHYAVADAFRFRFRTADPPQVVRAAAATAVRETTAHRSTGEVLVGNREELERETRNRLETVLQQLGVGLRVSAVTWQNVHAPPLVHPAFRDVASALEEKERLIREAEGYRAEVVAKARGKAESIRLQAESRRDAKVSASRGESTAFLSRLKAAQDSEELTRLRLFFDTAERSLDRAQLVLLLGDDVDVDVLNLGEAVLPSLQANKNQLGEAIKTEVSR
jgi:HflK protein